MKRLNLLIEKYGEKVIEILTVGLLVFIAYIVFQNNLYGLKDFNNSDIQRGFQRGVDVWYGVNSYLDFKPHEMLSQEKVPGFFPLYFFFMGLLAKISGFSFVVFIDVLRYVIFFCFSAIGILIYTQLRQNSKILAFTSAFIFMFNRWTLNDILALKQESYVILILLVSLIYLKKKTWLSMLLFGVATSIKHLTVLIAPVYLYELINPYLKSKGLSIDNFKKSLLYIVLLISPIVVPSIPYLIDSPEHYFNSILYNVTRESESDLSLKTGFDRLLILYNQDNENSFLYVLPRLPFVIPVILLAVLYFMKKIPLWIYCALTYLVFIGFNPTLFTQYYVWFLVFIPFMLKEIKINDH